ncbi:MAG: 16S rRNA (cytosine(967)-C(5))-methyltransferase RsmB [Candidatus Neomarinimicrobiota bacterium]
MAQADKRRGAPATVDAARQLAWGVLAAADRGGRINDLLHSALDESSLSPQERRFTTELVLGSTRMRARLDADLSACYQGRFGHLEQGVRHLLRMGAYQLDFMDSVPPHAALDTTVNLARANNLGRAAGLVNGVLRELSRREPQSPPSDLSDPQALATAYSHPQWLVDRWIHQWGLDRAVALLQWNNQSPTVWLRQRRDPDLRRQLAAVAAEKEVSLRPHGLLPDYVAVEPSPAPLLTTEVLAGGTFIVQDPSSGAVVAAIDPQLGETILDLCAGPGGKTAALAEAVGPAGRVAACELDPKRITLINDTLNRLGLKNVDLFPGDALKTNLPAPAKILIDAPCTGTGVAARRADLRWRRQPEHLVEMAAMQLTLLERAAGLLPPGGLLVYATCSLEPEENWDLVTTFQNRNPEYFLEAMPSGMPNEWVDERGALSTLPPQHGVDGVFAVRLSKG